MTGILPKGCITMLYVFLYYSSLRPFSNVRYKLKWEFTFLGKVGFTEAYNDKYTQNRQTDNKMLHWSPQS